LAALPAPQMTIDPQQVRTRAQAQVFMLMTNNGKIMGRVNGRAINIFGGLTTAAIFAATIGLVMTWLM
jgi:hypothetical protein